MSANPPPSNPSLGSPQSSTAYINDKEFWAQNGDTMFVVGHTKFRLDGSLLARNSPIIAKLSKDAEAVLVDGCKYVRIDSEVKVTTQDFVVLLQHLYRNVYVSQIR